tara:strand:+ start:2011 stop:2382 length:372 start_codon:yes stop_codon:yes gene_type:complete
MAKEFDYWGNVQKLAKKYKFELDTIDGIPLYKTEKEFTNAVRELALLNGWLYYHTYDSRRSDRGFPDCVFVKDGRVIFAELKVPRGKLSAYQKEWLTELNEVSGVEVYLWFPKDWDEIEVVLG